MLLLKMSFKKFLDPDPEADDFISFQNFVISFLTTDTYVVKFP